MQINDIDLHVEITGAGDPLVLVHGGWTDANSWRLVTPSLAEHFTVVTYDRRGHSRSERPSSHGSRRTDEADLEGVIAVLGVPSAHLAASSYGGSISLGLAARRPELVRSLTVHEPPLIHAVPPTPELAEVEALFRSIIDQLREGYEEAATRRFMEDIALGPGSWSMLPAEVRSVFVTNAPMFVANMSHPRCMELDVAALDEGPVPLLLADGDQTVPWLPHIIAELARQLPRAERHTFQGAGHAPHLTHPEEYADVVRAFAQRHARRAGQAA